MEPDYDIFISYAHIDNQTPVEGQEGWVSNFHKALAFRVSQLLGEKPKIWRDPKLQGNDAFADTLVDEVTKAEILVSILSPRYVKSEWCRRELEEFAETAEERGGLVLDNKSKVFKVVKTPVPLERHPEVARGLLGYEFYTVDPATGRPHEMLQMFGPEAEKDFWLKLDDLALDITSMLEKLHEEESVTPQNGSAASSEPRGTVFLAETTSDLKEQHDAIKRDLEQHGYEVVPDKALPFVADDLENATRQALAASKMSIHLVGPTYGLVPEGATDSMAALQYDLAIERHGGGEFPLIVWLPQGLTTDDPRQEEFTELVRSDPRTGDGADLLETPLEDLKTVVHQLLEPPPEPARAAEPQAAEAGETAVEDDGLQRIYLLCAESDLEAADALVGLLFDRGFEVVLPIFEGDEAEVRQDHEASLRLCDAILIYYGDSNDQWLRKKLGELRKIPSLNRTKPLLAKAIWVAPPETPQKKRLRTHEAEVIAAPDSGGEAAALAPLLDALGAAS